ncbi:MAG: hypothetical protein ACREOR_11045 [Candidatus Binatia bacterium]
MKMDDVHTGLPEDLAHYPLQRFISLDLSPVIREREVDLRLVRLHLDHLGRFVPIQCRIRHWTLERSILYFEDVHLAHFRDPEQAVFLLPPIERPFGDPQLSADISDQGTGIRLAERVANLRRGKP